MDIEDFERMRKKVPVICNLKPSGQFVRPICTRRRHSASHEDSARRGLLHGDCMTITGKTIAEELKDVPSKPRADQQVIFPIEQALYKEGHLAILKGNLAVTARSPRSPA
jgi:Dihydroxyacid dehydratase/phosphogluconate dehydratase